MVCLLSHCGYSLGKMVAPCLGAWTWGLEATYNGSTINTNAIQRKLHYQQENPRYCWKHIVRFAIRLLQGIQRTQPFSKQVNWFNRPLGISVNQNSINNPRSSVISITLQYLCVLSESFSHSWRSMNCNSKLTFKSTIPWTITVSLLRDYIL